MMRRRLRIPCILITLLMMNACGDNLVINEPPGPDAGPPPLTGASLYLEVLQSEDDTPLQGVRVTVGETGYTTDRLGRLLIDGLPFGRTVAVLQKPDYMPATVVVESYDGARIGKRVRLRAFGAPVATFDAAEGGALEIPGARITIPGSALVDSEGQPVTGQVAGTLHYIDPTTARPDELPGPSRGEDRTGMQVPLLQLALIEVSVWQDGQSLQLADDKAAQAQIAIPVTLAADYQAGGDMGLWWLDHGRGLWREQGQGSLVEDPDDPERLLWAGEIPHFSDWSPGDPSRRGKCFQVTFTDSAGKKLDNKDIELTVMGERRDLNTTKKEGDVCLIMKSDDPEGAFFWKGIELSTHPGIDGQSDSCDELEKCQEITLTLPEPPACDPGDQRPCRGTIQPGTETCDTSGQWASCVLSNECGNLVLEPGEACDEGDNTLTCNADCTPSVCGDGFLNPAAGEACDGAGDTLTCNADCTPSRCGDGAVNPAAGEVCDTGGNSLYCDDDCTRPRCGDGILNPEAGEQCDADRNTASCDRDCTLPRCGDGILNTAAGEECDDGNSVNNDSCRNDCKPGAVQPEFCDGDDSDGDGNFDLDACSCSSETIDGTQYLVCLAPVTWQRARAVCQANGRDLVIMNSQQENTAVSRRVYDLTPPFVDFHFWIGLDDRANEGDHVWLDGTATWSAYPWYLGDPNNFFDEDCVVSNGLLAVGAWVDLDCDDPIGFSRPRFVCE